MSNKIHIDELFREGLSNGEEAMVPSAWSNMAKMLEGENPYEKEQSKKRPFLWILGLGLLLISAIAAGTKFLFPGGHQQNAAITMVQPAEFASNKTEQQSSQEKQYSIDNSTTQEPSANLGSHQDVGSVANTNTTSVNSIPNRNTNATAAKQNTPTSNNNPPKKSKKENHANKQALNSRTIDKASVSAFNSNSDNDVALENSTLSNRKLSSNASNNSTQTSRQGNIEPTPAPATLEMKQLSILPLLSAQQFVANVNASKAISFGTSILPRSTIVMLPRSEDYTDTFGYLVAVNNKLSSTKQQSKASVTELNNKDSKQSEEPNKADIAANKKDKVKVTNASKAKKNKPATKNSEPSNAVASAQDNINGASQKGSTEAPKAKSAQNSNNQLLLAQRKEGAKKSTAPSAKEQMSERLMNTIEHIKQKGFVNLGAGNIKVDPALFAGINSQFLNNKNDLGGFHMGINCIIQIRRNIELMPHALFTYRTNGGYTIRDTVQTITDRSGPRFNGNDYEFSYTQSTTAMTYNFKRTMSIEAPIAIQWRPVRRVGIFAGVNLAYGFKYNTSNFYKTTTSTEVDLVADPQNYQFPTDRISTYKDIDFKGRLGAGYLIGANWQATPNFFVDARVAQNIWDNSTTPSSKIISSNVFKVPAFQLSLGYRFKGLQQ
jgi:hypothetical protein